MSADKSVLTDQRIIRQSETIEALKEEIERLRTALGFYADSSNWSEKRTLNEYLREPDDPKLCYYFSSALRAKLGHGCIVAKEALRNAPSGLWRIHGIPAMEKAWNDIAMRYQVIAEENRELRKALKKGCRYCNSISRKTGGCVMCAPRASDLRK
jgi:hypothetical protein